MDVFWFRETRGAAGQERRCCQRVQHHSAPGPLGARFLLEIHAFMFRQTPSSLDGRAELHDSAPGPVNGLIFCGRARWTLSSIDGRPLLLIVSLFKWTPYLDGRAELQGKHVGVADAPNTIQLQVLSMDSPSLYRRLLIKLKLSCFRWTVSSLDGT